MLTHTQSLRSLSLIYPTGLLEDVAVAAVSSGLKKNTTLRELTLKCCLRKARTSILAPILTSLHDHPLLRRLCLRGYVTNLTGLETVLLRENSKITDVEININTIYGGKPMIGVTHVMEALGRHPHPTLTKLTLCRVCIGRYVARQLRTVLRNTPSLQSLVLSHNTLGSVGLAELAPALYRNTSIKVLNLSGNDLNDKESARLLRDILRSNQTITTLDLSCNRFRKTTGAVECIADGLGSNSTLLKIDLSSCYLKYDGVSTLAQTLGSRNKTLQKLILGSNSITSIRDRLWRACRNDGTEQPPHYGSRPPVQLYWRRRSSSPSQVFRTQRIAKPHMPFSRLLQYRR